MDKQGAEKILSVYWFAILVIVAGGIFAMVYTFYHHPYDVREIEAGIMINNVADCISREGNLNQELFFGENFSEDFQKNFPEKCHLNFVSDEWEELQYYSEINFYKAENPEESAYNIAEGNKNLISSCEIQEEKEYKREATCVEKSFYSLKGEGLYLIKILSIVRKTEKNVK